MKMRVFAVCAVFFLFCGFAHADSAKLINPANGHSYQRFDTALDWNSAKTACAVLGGHLATITSQAENEWIYGNLMSGTISPSWVGGTDSVQEGVWKWITGEPWSYTNWSTGEPNGLTLENCLWMYGNSGPERGRWNDAGAVAYIFPYPCEWDNSVCADIVVKPHTFTTGTPAKAAEVNADIDTLYQQINTQNCQIQALKAIVCKNEPTASVCQ